MKIAVLILSLLIALPFAQAGSCPMQAGQDMALSGQETPPDNPDGHDCCPPEQQASDQPADDEGCGDASHCSACYVGASAIPAGFCTAGAVRPATAPHFLPAMVASSQPGAPFRPPIA